MKRRVLLAHAGDFRVHVQDEALFERGEGFRAVREPLFEVPATQQKIVDGAIGAGSFHFEHGDPAPQFEKLEVEDRNHFSRARLQGRRALQFRQRPKFPTISERPLS